MAIRPAERTLQSELLERTIEFDYSETRLAYSMLGLRTVMAWIFLQAGLSKLLEGGLGEPLAWSSASFLENVVAAANPSRGCSRGSRSTPPSSTPWWFSARS